MLKESKFENLTRSQVEALLECFDFLKNGYEEKASFEVDDLWIIQLMHKRTFKVIRMFIRPDRYRLQANGITRKKVMFSNGLDRYRIIVNSDATVGVIKTRSGAN